MQVQAVISSVNLLGDRIVFWLLVGLSDYVHGLLRSFFFRYAEGLYFYFSMFLLLRRISDWLILLHCFRIWI